MRRFSLIRDLPHRVNLSANGHVHPILRVDTPASPIHGFMRAATWLYRVVRKAGDRGRQGIMEHTDLHGTVVEVDFIRIISGY